MTLITFSGLDGAGKTTLIEWLRADLERQRKPVTVLRFNDDVGIYATARALRDRCLRRQPVDGPPRMEPRSPVLGRLRDALVWSKVLRRLLYPVDLLIFLCYRAYVEKLKRRILIMDRYFYDTLVDVTAGRRARGEGRWTRLLARLTPRPDLPVLLEITAEEAFARKGEYTVEYLRDREVAYHRVFPWVRAPLRLPGRELEAAKGVLARTMRERLKQ
jgi:thymidylate kinase